MSPYITFQIGNLNLSTTESKSSGKYPIWNKESVYFSQFSGTKMRVFVNCNPKKPTLIGFSEFNLENVLAGFKYDGWIEVYSDYKKTGDIKLTIEFMPQVAPHQVLPRPYGQVPVFVPHGQQIPGQYVLPMPQNPTPQQVVMLNAQPYIEQQPNVRSYAVVPPSQAMEPMAEPPVGTEATPLITKGKQQFDYQIDKIVV
eukprot:TRINITY_DN1067_c0_g1_i3.p1 TRINITY_DN1067_c0_g1~~TRINITY_DN1067_c0_g1_i3.p1  ORF type:complete len:233 (+),score=20.84 TRINITY_DN1067_c0_g1_i3:105-701(+)